jgi:monoamine oxidase
MERKTIIIVGGGISGLVAARLLSSMYNVILLEALRRFGGRICTLDKKEFPMSIEGGAEFVHGKAPETKKLLKSAGLKYTKVEGKFYRKKKNSLILEEDAIDGWEKLLQQMGELQEDMTLNHFLDTYFQEKHHEQLRQEARNYAEGFDIADPDKVSVKSLHREWSHQSSDHRVDDGYGALIKFLVKDARNRGCRLITGAIVERITWQNQISISTIDNQLFKADKCLLTIPLGVLQNREGLSITFDPPITDYINASRKMGYGKVIKVVLAFKSRFWKKDAGFFLSDDKFSAWWTQLPSPLSILTGWAGGPKAEELSLLSSTVLLETAINSLANLFKIDEMILKESLEGWHVFNWQKEKSILGGYSYATPETSDALKLLNTPINDLIFFAGEGIYSGDHPGTIEAAIVSAKQTAAYLLKR